MVSQSSIIMMAVVAIVGIIIPAALCIYFKKKYNCSLKAFFIGCGVMFVFALTLEQLVHMLVLTSPVGVAIQSNIWMYGLYGGFMAGLFEETGRFVAFKFLLKKERENDHTGLMYGAGHGGFEAFYLLTLTMATNLSYAMTINAGQVDALLTSVPAESQGAMMGVIASLTGTAPAMYLVSIIERGAAVIVQLGLSVLVWFAVKNAKKIWLFPLAIALHMLLDFVAVVVNGLTQNIVLVEVLIWVMALGIAAFARSIWKKNKA